ncbi:MAG: gamma-glutamylcyclotransferase [Flavobacteriaceae bacterium]|nr:gamma-glutamylcyclotransferase [Flavobacteriaceae bacterium]
MRAKYTQYLFTYGTLQDEVVQLRVFGRKPKSKEAKLKGYRIAEEKVMDLYPTIEPSDQVDGFVAGLLLRVSNLELFNADVYETQAYKRIMVSVNPRTKAWVYIATFGLSE